MKKTKWLLWLIMLSFAIGAHAKTAKEIFAVASKSIVIVKAFDERFNLKASGSGVVVKVG